eukprot:TRINITY_DN8489_c0_g1_i1.p1 TRINITY_DN8489_c0_g1~~TRINITY_DN8489_c0_g1_i1.p1  ORF type:complete len:190 (-),score=22.26 TRINITY_DN8489_c0_g1_i1:130-699(-)
MSVAGLKENWKDTESCQKINKPRLINCSVTGIDISGPALEYGRRIGLFQKTIQTNVNDTESPNTRIALAEVAKSDLFILAGTTCYLSTNTIQVLVDEFVSCPRQGFLLINFMSLFDSQNVNFMKRIVLNRLHFVGSLPTIHRKLTPNEREAFPEEKYVTNETWVLSRQMLWQAISGYCWSFHDLFLQEA